MAWSKTIPAASDSPCASTVQITSNWSAIEDWWGVEHYTFTSALSGMHKYGVLGVVLTGTNATIKAVSSPGTGALAWDNTCGVLRIYKSDGAWDRITEDHYSRVLLKNTTGQAVPATAWALVAFDTETYDGLGEYSSVGPTLAFCADGYYLVQATAVYPDAWDHEKGIGIYQEGTRIADGGGYGKYLRSVQAIDVVKADASDAITIYVYNGDSTASVTVESVEVTLTRLT